MYTYIVLLVTCLLGSHAYVDESRLVSHLLQEYKKNVRPAKPSESVPVIFGLTLIQILNLDENTQTLHMLAWLNKDWQDQRLKWKPADYGGVQSVRISADDIWRPDIILYNSVRDRFEYAADVFAVAHSSGYMNWIPPIHLQSACVLDLTLFPFDTQTCTLKFGSWTYDSSKVNISLHFGRTGADTTSYIENRDWRLTGNKAVRNSVKYDCCPEEYQDITFSLTLKRRNLHYTYTLVAPSVILALILPLVFLLPPGSQEKMALGVGVLLGLILLALTLQSMLPPTGYFLPALALYNLSCVGLTAFSLAMATIVNATWCKKGELPGPVQMVLSGLGRLLCVQASPEDYQRHGQARKDSEVPVLPDEGRQPPGDWQQLALVLDRLCLLLVMVVLLIITIVFHA